MPSLQMQERRLMAAHVLKKDQRVVLHPLVGGQGARHRVGAHGWWKRPFVLPILYSGMAEGVVL